MKKALFAIVVAGTLVVSHIPSALGSENGFGPKATEAAPSQLSPLKDLRLPRAPSPDLMPWVSPGWLWSEPQIDSTWRPDLDRIQPFELQPTSPNDQAKSIVRSSSSS
ncbi:MAG TPA: hypothetical protein VKW08_27380 [Xanthobacteraceae bacterium]|jgi:hypothetical protein|nr:hypothetical protein [Xanthobacteraceae bacterium]